MKTILLVLACGALVAQVTTLGLMTVKMPVYLHDADEEGGIQISDVPVMSASSSEARYGAISHPFIPPCVSSWVKPVNINIASQYGIHVSMEEAIPPVSSHWIITVDASGAKRPEGYPFTIEQVTDAVVTCVKLMTPIVPEDERKVTIKMLPAKK